MHIIAIGWLWVAFMMAITQKSSLAGLSTFVFYGVLPCALLLYLLTAPARRRRRAQRDIDQIMHSASSPTASSNRQTSD